MVSVTPGQLCTIGKHYNYTFKNACYNNNVPKSNRHLLKYLQYAQIWLSVLRLLLKGPFNGIRPLYGNKILLHAKLQC